MDVDPFTSPPPRRSSGTGDAEVDALTSALGSVALREARTPRRSPITVRTEDSQPLVSLRPAEERGAELSDAATPVRCSPISRAPGVPELHLPVLRDYQLDICNTFDDILSRNTRKVCVFLPTGGGKTRIAFELIWRRLNRGMSALFVVNRDTLVSQTVGVAEAAGLGHLTGIISGRSKTALASGDRLVVASIQALDKRGRDKLPSADFIVIDEAHCAIAPTYRHLLAAYPTAAVLGLTATPTRMLPFEHLSAVFGRLLRGPDVARLVQRGFLAPPYVVDLAGETMGRPGVRYRLCNDDLASKQAIAIAVDAWLERARSLRTLCFAGSVAHSRAMADAFRRRGVTAEHVDGRTRKRERERLFEALRAGSLRVLSSVGVLTEGFDEPRVRCVMLCRATESPVMHVQQVGRGLRAAEGKRHCIVLDQAGNTWRHGSVMDPPKYLSSWRGRAEEAGAFGTPSLGAAPGGACRGADRDERAVKVCPGGGSERERCAALLHPGAAVCHVCGHAFERGEPGPRDRDATAAPGTRQRHRKKGGNRRGGTSRGRKGRREQEERGPEQGRARASPSPAAGPGQRARHLGQKKLDVDVGALLEAMIDLDLDDAGAEAGAGARASPME